jgi:CBS-domain-containing membrane protein
MYRFLEGTADQYMTRAVTTVTRQTTMHELEALFEKHDFNSFPVVEKRKDVGDRYKIPFCSAISEKVSWSFSISMDEADPTCQQFCALFRSASVVG